MGRTIDAAGTVDTVGMTVEACLTFCASKGYPYAGLEYYHECFCGATLAPTSAEAPDAQCQAPCAGNANEACGGGSRLSLYHSNVVTGPSANPGVDGWNYVGCWS